VPEIGDHGCIITMVDVKEKTNEVIYTVNNPEDLHEWFSCKFADDNSKITARNIRVSEGWDSRRFLMYGQKKDATTGALNAVVVHLNFDNEFSGKCTDADFEDWTPKDEHGNCVMGRATTYQRRAKGKTCYLSEDHQGKTKATNCECQTEDYECAHCFFRPDLGSECQLQCIVPNLPPEPAFCVNSTTEKPLFYYVDQIGNRLVDNDTCDPSRPNAEKPRAKIFCQARSPTTGTPPFHVTMESAGPWPAIIVTVLVLVVVVGIFWALWKYNSSFYNCISYTFGVDDGRESQYQTVPPPPPSEQGESLALDLDDTEQ